VPLTSGTRLGPYEIESPAGSGGMGEVYRARDTRLERVVAIKVLPTHFADSSERRQRFEREARAVSSLSHPHICTLHDVGRQEGLDYLVMEYLEGETLAARLEKGPLPTEQLLRLAIQITDALDKAHRQGVVHRDLKPGNIMLTRNGAKLMDFGLAKTATAPATGTALEAMTQSRPLTAQGTIVGTFQYLAPEQLEGKEADARSDIFSLGAVLYEMATGRPAFSGKTQASVIASVLASEPPPITSLQPMTPPALERVVKTCLAKDPDDRLQMAHDLKLQLEWILEGGSAIGVPAPAAARGRRWERLAWAAGLLAALALGHIAALYMREAPKPPYAIRSHILPPEKSEFLFSGNFNGPPAISPDGRLVTFAARVPDGRFALWVRPLDGLSAQPLAGTENATFPFWSPNSRTIGFFVDGKLKKIEAGGGPAQGICDAPIGRGGAWNQDGTIIFAASVAEPLQKVAAAGGVPAVAVKFDPARQDNSHRWPYFLPDGRHFLYWSRSADPEKTGIYIGSLDSDHPSFFLRSDTNAIYAAPGYLLFLRDQTLVAQPFDARKLKFTGDLVPVGEGVQVNPAIYEGVFSASENGVLLYQTGATQLEGWDLRWYDRSGKQLGTLPRRDKYFEPRLSPDDKRIAVQIGPVGTVNDIWILELARGTRTRLTFSSASKIYPVWSPDGSRLAFASNRKTGQFHIYAKASNGVGDEETLLEDKVNGSPSDWSRDGRYIAYFGFGASGKWGVGILPLFGDKKPFPFLRGESNQISPAFSPDGKWLAYSSDETGRFEVYVAPFPSSQGKWQISTAGGFSPRWRGDGKELFFFNELERRMMAVAVQPKGSSLEVGAPQALFQATNAATGYAGTYDVTADGKRFLVNTFAQQPSTTPITLVTNWAAGLKSKR